MVKDKIVPTQAIKACGGRRVIAPFINDGAKGRWVYKVGIGPHLHFEVKYGFHWVRFYEIHNRGYFLRWFPRKSNKSVNFDMLHTSLH